MANLLKLKQIEAIQIANVGGLQTDLNAKAAAISAEETARAAGDVTLQSAIDVEKGRIDQILNLSGADADTFKEIVDLINSVDLDNDNALASAITSLNAADATLQGNIDSEASARSAADATLQGNIDSEASARSAADATLQGNIDSESSARQSADATLQGNINSEETARIAGDTALQVSLTAEETARIAGDTTLQSNINTLEAAVAKTGDDETISGNWDFSGTIGFGGTTFSSVSTDLSVSASATEFVTAEAAKSYVDSVVGGQRLQTSRTDTVGNDSTTTYSYAVSGQNDELVIVMLNGKTLIPVTDYTDNGSSVVFPTAPESDDVVTIAKWFRILGN